MKIKIKITRKDGRRSSSQEKKIDTRKGKEDSKKNKIKQKEGNKHRDTKRHMVTQDVTRRCLKVKVENTRRHREVKEHAR